MPNPDWLKASFVQKIVDGKAAETGVQLQKDWIDEKGDRQVTKIWLSVDEAKTLTQSLYDLLRTPPSAMDFSALNRKP